MAVLIMGYEKDEAFAALFGTVIASRLTAYGYRTEMGPSQPVEDGRLISGRVSDGNAFLGLDCLSIAKAVNALGAAQRVGYTSGNSVLIGVPSEDQAERIDRSRVLCGDGYAVFRNQSVPGLAEIGNAILVTGPVRPDLIAALAFRYFVFPRGMSSTAFAPRGRQSYLVVPGGFAAGAANG